ncbi:MAG TPA: CHAT domain-containing protein [Blastocatellia bacterium]|nr:CHAT domain-containing protein [Blastocatellia bacterium]
MAMLDVLTPNYDDIEVRLLRDYEKNYVAELSGSSGHVSCKLPPAPLDELASEYAPRVYGPKLYTWLFQDDVLAAFQRARWSADGSTHTAPSSGLRLRLWIDPKLAELHHVWWEAMIDPLREAPLCLDLAMSRYLRVSQARGWPIAERPLRMLTLVASPRGVENFDLPSIDLSQETSIIGKATAGLQPFVQNEILAEDVTPERVMAELSKGYHILHILAHPVRFQDRYCLLLSDADGNAVPVALEKLAQAMEGSSASPPCFVFLATPMKADEQVGELLVQAAPSLVAAGAQAVLAIQAAMEVDTLRLFAERLYTALIRTGTVDNAVTVARSAVYYARPDSWEWALPVLYMRTPDGQLFQPLSEVLEEKVQRLATALQFKA